MKKFASTIFCIMLPLGHSIAGSAYDQTLKGKKCKVDSQQQLGCEYKVGNDLEFSIDGIGTPSTGITFIRANYYTGDYYAKYGLLHGCVVVTHGKKYLGFMRDFSFISPKNGKVYKTWEACKQGM